MYNYSYGQTQFFKNTCAPGCHAGCTGRCVEISYARPIHESNIFLGLIVKGLIVDGFIVDGLISHSHSHSHTPIHEGGGASRRLHTVGRRFAPPPCVDSFMDWCVAMAAADAVAVAVAEAVAEAEPSIHDQSIHDQSIHDKSLHSSEGEVR